MIHALNGSFLPEVLFSCQWSFPVSPFLDCPTRRLPCLFLTRWPSLQRQHPEFRPWSILSSCHAHSSGILLHPRDRFSIHLLVIPRSSFSLNLSSFLQGCQPSDISVHVSLRLPVLSMAKMSFTVIVCPWALSLSRGHLLPSRHPPAKLSPLSPSQSDFPSPSLEHQVFFLSPNPFK